MPVTVSHDDDSYPVLLVVASVNASKQPVPARVSATEGSVAEKVLHKIRRFSVGNKNKGPIGAVWLAFAGIKKFAL